MFIDFGPLILVVLAFYLVTGVCLLALVSMTGILIARVVRRSKERRVTKLPSLENRQPSTSPARIFHRPPAAV